MNKKELALLLSKLGTFEKLNVNLEQYQTPSEIAADVLWFAYMQGDVTNKKILDLGCGTGILGIGALILGAKKVIFVDADKEAIKIAKVNKEFIEGIIGKRFNAGFVNKKIEDFKGKADVVIQNPPFGVQKSHSDRPFLIKAMESADIVYTFHKISTKSFVESLIDENGFRAKNLIYYNFPLERKFWFHTRKRYYVGVCLWKIEKFKKRTKSKK